MYIFCFNVVYFNLIFNYIIPIQKNTKETERHITQNAQELDILKYTLFKKNQNSDYVSHDIKCSKIRHFDYI